MYNVLITGGTGFIGHWLGSTPHGVVSLMTRQIYERGKWYDGDWRYIIHLAPVPVDDVLKCAQRCNATVLLASSGGVYDKDLQDYFKMKLDDEYKLLNSGLDVKVARKRLLAGDFMDITTRVRLSEVETTSASSSPTAARRPE